jgi:hypothetical protein
MNPPSQQVIRILSSALSELNEMNNDWNKQINDEQELINCEAEAAEIDVAWKWLNETIAATATVTE